jgi:hypothetical protein
MSITKADVVAHGCDPTYEEAQVRGCVQDKPQTKLKSYGELGDTKTKNNFFKLEVCFNYKST